MCLIRKKNNIIFRIEYNNHWGPIISYDPNDGVKKIKPINTRKKNWKKFIDLNILKNKKTPYKSKGFLNKY